MSTIQSVTLETNILCKTSNYIRIENSLAIHCHGNHSVWSYVSYGSSRQYLLTAYQSPASRSVSSSLGDARKLCLSEYMILGVEQGGDLEFIGLLVGNDRMIYFVPVDKSHV